MRKYKEIIINLIACVLLIGGIANLLHFLMDSDSLNVIHFNDPEDYFRMFGRILGNIGIYFVKPFIGIGIFSVYFVLCSWWIFKRYFWAGVTGTIAASLYILRDTMIFINGMEYTIVTANDMILFFSKLVVAGFCIGLLNSQEICSSFERKNDDY